MGEAGKTESTEINCNVVPATGAGDRATGAPRAAPRTWAPSGGSESILGEGNAFLLMLFVTLYNFVSHLVK